MKYFTILLFTLSLSFTSAIAQTIEWRIPGTDTIYNAKFKKFKDICLRKMKTESHVEAKKAMTIFLDKLSFSGKPSEFPKDTLLPWIKENLQKTKFTSYEEAEQVWQQVTDTGLADVKENMYYFEAIAELSKNGDNKIFMDVRQEIEYEYPGKL